MLLTNSYKAMHVKFGPGPWYMTRQLLLIAILYIFIVFQSVKSSYVQTT